MYRSGLLLLSIGTVLWVPSAYADHSSLHATASGDVAVTDNAFAAPTDGDRQVDMYTQLKPGVLATYEAPRMVHELNVELEVLEYLVHNDQLSLLAHGGWRAQFLPGPRSTLALAANGGTGQVNALAGNTSPDQASTSLIPAGALALRAADASQNLSWQSTKDTRVSQNAFVRWNATNDEAAMPTTTNSVETGLGFGFEQSFKHDSFGLEAGGSFLRFERIAPPGALMGSRLDRQINPRASLVWRHDIDKHWSTNLSGGVVYVNPVGVDPYNPMATDRRASPYPVFTGTLAYSEAWGRATLIAQRSVSPNLYIAQNTVSDGAALQLALPLPWFDPYPRAAAPKFAALGTAGFERTQLVDPQTAQLQGAFDVVHLDAGVIYTPRPGESFGARYEFLYVHGDAMAAMVTPSFVRNTLFFTFALRWPQDVAATVPRRTQSLRADRGDLQPLGSEPVVPDAAEPPAE